MLTPLRVVIAVEILGVAGMIFGFLPRETALFLLGIFVYFTLFAPRRDAIFFAVFSIPLYTALPITEGFDTMAGWRIIIAILFLRVLLRRYDYNSPLPPLTLRGGTQHKAWWRLPPLKVRGGKEGLSFVLLILFFAISALSLLAAPEPSFGIRKLLFLANALFLFFIIQQVVKNKQDWLAVFKYTFAGALLALAVGYAQITSVFLVSLHSFWMWWVHHVIPVFYGLQLSNLLSYSNTWFSYYENAEPTLRVFSVFPDSHSFALAMVLLLPMALTYYLTSAPPKAGRRWIWEIIIVLALLAIIFSGTRGAWVGAIPVFIVLVFLYCVYRKHPPLLTTEGGILGETVKACVILFLVFAFLFPVASQFQKILQWRQGGKISETTTISRITTSFQTGELSNKGRIQIWKSTLESIAKHPFLGVGIGNYPVVLSENVSATKKGASAHSLYLDFLAEIGILGGIVVLLIFLEILRKAVKIFLAANDPFFRAFSGFFAIFLLWVMAYSIVDVVLLNDKVLLMFLTLAGLLYAIPQAKTSPPDFC